MNLLDWARDIRKIDAVEANSVGFMPVYFVKHPMPRSETYSDSWNCQNGAESLQGIRGLNSTFPYGGFGRRVVVDMTTSLVRSDSTIWNLGASPSHYTLILNRIPSGGPNGTLSRVRTQVCALTSCEFRYSDARYKIPKAYEFRVTDDRPWMPNEHGDWNGELNLTPEFSDWVKKSVVPVDLRVVDAF